MNTEKMMQFDVLDMEALEMIEGGNWNWKRAGMCALSIGYGAAEGYMLTAGATFVLGPYAFGTGAVGAVVGGIGGAFTC